MMDPAAMRKLLEANGAAAQPYVPKPQQSYTPPSASYGVPQGSSVTVPPQPGRWNPDASYQDRLSHFGGNGNDARNEILAVKDLYNNEMKGGASADRLGQIYGWAQQVRKAAGIDENDYTYGNGPAPQAPNNPVPSQPGATQPQGGGYTGGSPSAPPSPSYVPPVNMSQYKPMNPEQIRAEAQAKINAELAKRTTAANQAKQGINTSYDRLRKNIGEDRTLSDWKTSQQLDPTNGMSGYEKGVTSLQRERTDREQQQDLQTRLANIDVTLQDYVNATPEQQRALENELIRQERTYGLQVDQQAFGQFDANRKFDRGALESDRNFGLQEGQLTGNYQNAPTLAAQQFGQQQKKDNWSAYLDSVGLTGNTGSGPKSDWGLLGGTNGAPSYQAQQSMTQLTGRLPNGQPTTAEQQRQLGNWWKVADETGTIPDEIANMYGIPKGTQTQQAKQYAMNYSLQDDQFRSGVDQKLFDSMNKQGTQQQGPKVSDVSQNINRAITTLPKDPVTGQVNVQDPNVQKQIESMIISQTHDPLVAVPLYNMYGLPVPPQLQQEYQQSLKANP